MPAPEPAKKTAPRKPAAKAATPVTTDGEGKVVVTLKGGTGFDAPWIVIHADSPADAAAQIGQDLLDLMDKTHRAAAKFVELAPNKPAQGGNQPAPRQAAPAGATQAPPGSPECPPGWEFKTGFSQKTQKPWKGYFPPRGSTDKPIFF
ncbi:hypothetical protein SAMN05421776_11732 [Nocardia farcinica]|uniref:Uncharacterized protein n=2 Tax=Actinomycetota TaxID=201174 RepID=A0A0H5NVK4_NOCFR|nr:hypothetical protein CJ469_05639 [Nocardia farcinica]PFX06077.1 hypothetical protein CJ468_04937 [Nocardia farcinica]CRY79830.1 Uncharacterised protein [Nocardia farcinica]SIT33600.1 hypothetical protein SAMN05421776_11732 [Nocardia farcinica]